MKEVTMSNNKQSSVDWLHSKILLRIGLENSDIIELRYIIEQVKEIHRVEIIEAYAAGSNDRLKNIINTEYYKENFK
jgi:hypothetical protein